MRWVALLLILANAGAAGWLYLGAPGRPQSVAEAPPEIGQLALLREEADSRTGTAVPAEEEAVCFTIGPFDDAGLAERASQQLRALGLEPDQRVLSEEEVYGYQVLLPPFPDREAAIDATRRLAEKGIQEYFVVTEPELENAVSLGLFRQKRFATRHNAYLRELGFEPEMRVRTRERDHYWQDYRDPEGLVTPELLDSLSTEQPLQRLERPCSPGQQ